MKYKTKRKYQIYRERGNRLINKSAFVFKNMSRDCFRHCYRTNRIIKRDIELKGERTGKEGRKRKVENGRMKDKFGDLKSIDNLFSKF